jgi:hypothetical protein
MERHLNRYYIIMLSLAFLATLHSLVKPGISSPLYPTILSEKFNRTDILKSALPVTTKELRQDTSDRKFSKLYEYNFADGSRLFAVMVRVRKRDDFKIETYGLLTKNVDPIYIRSPIPSNSIPFSMIGTVHGRKTFQTCVIPGTTQLGQVNVQLFPLLTQADKLAVHSHSQSLFSKFFGTDDKSDYSCLVLTYQPKTSGRVSRETWVSIISNAQLALASGQSYN